MGARCSCGQFFVGCIQMQPKLVNVDKPSPWHPVNPYLPGPIPEQLPKKQIPLRECLVGNS